MWPAWLWTQTKEVSKRSLPRRLKELSDVGQSQVWYSRAITRLWTPQHSGACQIDPWRPFGRKERHRFGITCDTLCLLILNQFWPLFFFTKWKSGTSTMTSSPCPMLRLKQDLQLWQKDRCSQPLRASAARITTDLSSCHGAIKMGHVRDITLTFSKKKTMCRWFQFSETSGS